MTKLSLLIIGILMISCVGMRPNPPEDIAFIDVDCECIVVMEKGFLDNPNNYITFDDAAKDVDEFIKRMAERWEDWYFRQALKNGEI